MVGGCPLPEPFRRVKGSSHSECSSLGGIHTAAAVVDVLADGPTSRPDWGQTGAADVFRIRLVVPAGSGRSTLVAVV
jgi:hypothetical protein